MMMKKQPIFFHIILVQSSFLKFISSNSLATISSIHYYQSINRIEYSQQRETKRESNNYFTKMKNRIMMKMIRQFVLVLFWIKKGYFFKQKHACLVFVAQNRLRISIFSRLFLFCMDFLIQIDQDNSVERLINRLADNSNQSNIFVSFFFIMDLLVCSST